MCMEDVRIGRRKINSYKSISMQPGDIFQAGAAAKNRTRIRIGTSSGTLTISPLNSDGPLNSGFIANITKPDFEIDIETHGDIVTQAWVVRAGGVMNVSVIETFLEDK